MYFSGDSASQTELRTELRDIAKGTLAINSLLIVTIYGFLTIIQRKIIDWFSFILVGKWRGTHGISLNWAANLGSKSWVLVQNGAMGLRCQLGDLNSLVIISTIQYMLLSILISYRSCYSK